MIEINLRDYQVEVLLELLKAYKQIEKLTSCASFEIIIGGNKDGIAQRGREVIIHLYT